MVFSDNLMTALNNGHNQYNLLYWNIDESHNQKSMTSQSSMHLPKEGKYRSSFSKLLVSILPEDIG